MTPSDSPRVNPLAAHFTAMARNNAWSNLRLYRACVTLTDDAFAERRVSFFPSLQLTLNLKTAVEADGTAGDAMPGRRDANWAYSPNG